VFGFKLCEFSRRHVRVHTTKAPRADHSQDTATADDDAAPDHSQDAAATSSDDDDADN
jgi:hypothetical protein